MCTPRRQQGHIPRLQQDFVAYLFGDSLGPEPKANGGIKVKSKEAEAIKTKEEVGGNRRKEISMPTYSAFSK